MLEKLLSPTAWQNIFNNWPSLLAAFGYTLLIAVLGLIFAMILGVIFGLASSSHSKLLRGISRVYVEFFQNTPLLIQIIFMYIVLPMVGIVLGKIQIAVIALALYHGAYISEIVRSAVDSVARGQMEAAKSQGFSYLQSMWYIILPQAMRIMLPPLSNQAVNLTKNTSAIAVVAGAEMMYWAKSISATSGNYAPAFFVIAVLYFLICFPMAKWARRMEEKNKKAFSR